MDPTSIPPLPEGLPDTLASRVANRLHSFAVRLIRRARVEDRATGLTPERLSILSVLVFGGDHTVSELADVEMVSAPAMSRSLRALESLGYVRRTRSREDQRQVVVRVTRRGRALVGDRRRRRVERVAEELAQLTAEELALVERATAILLGAGAIGSERALD